jgi:NADH:ubiquinone oxidoreductase subunit 3 (subunit A)
MLVVLVMALAMVLAMVLAVVLLVVLLVVVVVVVVVMMVVMMHPIRLRRGDRRNADYASGRGNHKELRDELPHSFVLILSMNPCRGRSTRIQRRVPHY